MKLHSPHNPIHNQPTDPSWAMRTPEVEHAFGSPKLVRDLRRAGWLKPVVQRHRLTLFDRVDVLRCWERLRAGETPGAAPATSGEVQP